MVIGVDESVMDPLDRVMQLTFSVSVLPRMIIVEKYYGNRVLPFIRPYVRVGGSLGPVPSG